MGRTLGDWWHWFSNVERALAQRGALVSQTRRALATLDGEERAEFIFEIERQIAKIDDYAVTADHLSALLNDPKAIRALQNVSRKLDRLSVTLVGLVVRHFASASSINELRA